MKKDKHKDNVYYIKEYRNPISLPVRCTMADCIFIGMVAIHSRKNIEDVRCPKCVNQSLELVYPS